MVIPQNGLTMGGGLLVMYIGYAHKSDVGLHAWSTEYRISFAGTISVLPTWTSSTPTMEAKRLMQLNREIPAHGVHKTISTQAQARNMRNELGAKQASIPSPRRVVCPTWLRSPIRPGGVPPSTKSLPKVVGCSKRVGGGEPATTVSIPTLA